MGAIKTVRGAADKRDKALEEVTGVKPKYNKPQKKVRKITKKGTDIADDVRKSWKGLFKKKK